MTIDESCWRVPVTGAGARTRLGRDWHRRAALAKDLGELPRTWAPIVTAVDADEARAKVLVLLDGIAAVIGTPVQKCPPMAHIEHARVA